MARNKPHKPRVFCIGWHKTGTSTMGLALLELGYTVLGARLDMAEPLLAEDLDAPLEVAGQFDALQDVPWAALFKKLDERYPKSKFILTVRDEEVWLNSASKHFKDSYYALHKWLYGKGVLEGNEELYLKRFRQHYQEVKEYFKNRPEDLLVMDFTAGDGWKKLCDFLGHPKPQKPFPHANKGKHSFNKKDKLIFSIRRIVPWWLRKYQFYFRVQVLKVMGRKDPRNRFNNFHENKKYVRS